MVLTNSLISPCNKTIRKLIINQPINEILKTKKNKMYIQVLFYPIYLNHNNLFQFLLQ